MDTGLEYGVLRARPDLAKREDGGSTPHLQIRALDEFGEPWRVAVNVQSDDGSEVVFWIVDPLVGHPILDFLEDVPAGFTTTAARSAHSLDYVKAPLFDFALGRALPPSGSANADDLQDLLTLYLTQCKASGGELYAFGAQFDRDLHKPIDAEFGNTDGLHGVHDIHMNQGNVGAHSGDNGPFHDGGLLLRFPDRIMGIFLAFQTQRVPTDRVGAASADAQPLSTVIASQPDGPRQVAVGVYLERALINPVGTDPGREVVVLGNLTTATKSLRGWQLVDLNGRVTKLDVEIPSGASAIVTLNGSGVQLGNSGGNLILQDDQTAQVDSVTYSAADAATIDRYVRFQR
ncbi:uncharacterized protein YukJ [Mycolicibacterium sp. BK556]|uniref:DUF2278 family protein n=1 Tax=unclassified Mycolicibacterium TaxID=2636767 RepID=UPI0016120E3A|nr:MULTISPECIES: DUF2278 family protein [unclassified Mycolicibacterium]MBB3606634.1 uncharacterized protein YukJ [Mycolicibacterium sp. BK556]MBB3636119.1 uncharacterized protein YukJ [Mycolicibacterium sp. BK607]MBB3753747.1 uncharacterized protein YukJ [Mycolicibacterium sp. BK634]